jgi:Tfp pilus assembly protein PilO
VIDDLDEMDRRESRWHVGKEIPIAVLLMLAVQTAGGIWWAASLSQKLDSVISQVAELRAERYTKEDARRDMELMKVRDTELERRIASMEQHR